MRLLIVAMLLCLAGTQSAIGQLHQFEYELWMRAETSLDQGPIEIQGRLVNTGSVALSLPPQWGALGGLPQNLNSTTCGLECVNAQLSTAGSFLAPGNYLDFIWLSGTQEEDLSSRAGELVMGGLGLVPFGSDWHWTQGGFIAELLVDSTWVNGPIDPNLPFNVVRINLDVAHEYIEGCSLFPGGGSTEGCFPGPGPFPAAEPGTLALLGIGLAGLAFSRRKRAA